MSLSLLSLSLLPAPVHAGSYTVVYSGGYNGASRAAPVNPTEPDYPTSDGWGGSNGGGTGACACSGLITATFTWQAAFTGDQPPAQVGVLQTCTATAFATSYPNGYPNVVSAACDDGLGSSNSSSPAIQPGGTTASVSCTDMTFQVKGGQSFSVTCSPSAQASGNSDMEASVSYSASTVTVTLGGAIQDSNGTWHILVGQGCTASLSPPPAGCTYSNFQWTIPGNTFEKFTIASDQSSGGPVYTSPADWSSASPHFYWYTYGTGTVSVTANVIYAGKSLGSVSAQAPG